MALICLLPPTSTGCASDSEFEAAQTRKLLGVPVHAFPGPQGPAQFDELVADAPPFAFTAEQRPLSGPEPRASYERRQTVSAVAPDGTVYEAYCGYGEDAAVAPGHRFVSDLYNRRQRYGTMYWVAQYYPEDVYVGRREGGRLKPTLFFRDVGSHTTAPHALAVDARGRCHLVVADVNIDQDNRLELYWVTGDPRTGRWTDAHLVDRRGFTSWSRPWSAARGDDVHLLWNWVDGSDERAHPDSGIFHVVRSAGRFTRKVRIARGPIDGWGAAIDPASGRLIVAFAGDDGVYVVSRSDAAGWTAPARLYAADNAHGVEVTASGDGAFVVRVTYQPLEWVVRPR